MPSAPTQGQGPTDPTELEDFLDDFIARNMEEYHIPGVAISVVKDGELFFAKGYGYADLENGIPVDPEQTVFRIGSVGKLFTRTAMMQLVEQGKLNLDADITHLSRFSHPGYLSTTDHPQASFDPYGRFRDLWFEVLVWDADDLMPVGEWLAFIHPFSSTPPH